MVPVTDHTRGEDQQRKERQGNCENAIGLLHCQSTVKMDDRYRLKNILNSISMWDVRKALPVAMIR
jgi:hypothetical protein